MTGNFAFRKIDVTKPETLKGICDGADCMITTVGLTKSWCYHAAQSGTVKYCPCQR